MTIGPLRPSSGDLSAWRRLVREARRSAADPNGKADALAKAEKSAKRALVLGAVAKENPCIQLVRTARQFVAETVRGRRDLADAMLTLAQEVDRRLTEQAVTSAPRRPRADIDG
jgi:hypothetical protein